MIGKIVLSLGIALLASAPAFSATTTLTPLHDAQSTVSALSTACADANSPARADEVFFEMPAVAAAQGVTGTSTVEIALNAKGDLVSQNLYTSSGNALLDEASMRSARLSRFTAETRDCRAVGGTYLYSVEY